MSVKKAAPKAKAKAKVNVINKALSKIGAPVWRLFQTSKHHHIGAVVVLLIAGAAVAVWLNLPLV